GHLATRLETAGREQDALALIDRVLATEPPELQEIHPGKEPTSIPVHAALIAGAFAPLQARAATLCQRLGLEEEAEHHARQQRILEEIASQLHERQPRATPN
ncbi:MAG TPA: hypothetical protein VNI57_08540, partial [Candidatus Saccharimonadales bacterium]|nr:hypothetical protein [Candidatus Saccharimonadales bacterium]